MKFTALMLLLTLFLLPSAQAKESGAPYVKKEVQINGSEKIKILIIPHPLTPLLDSVCVILSDLKNNMSSIACPEYMSGFYETEKNTKKR